MSAGTSDAGPAGAAPRHVTVRRDGPLLHVTMNRPEVRNAMSLAMVRELRDAMRAADGADGARVLVLRGAGGHFCAGADIKDMAAARAAMQGDPQALERTNAAFGELCVAFAAVPLATVAVLEGSVMGGGFGLACTADLAIAGTSTQFRLPEVSLGLVPAQIAPFLVERLGLSTARRLAITAARIDADEALRLGLVHEVHPAGALDAAVQAAVAPLLQCAPGAIAATKALMARARFTPAAELVADAARVFSAAATSAEGVEGTLAFVQKRRPSWAGGGSAGGGGAGSSSND